MKPKEKAKELVDRYKFMEIANYTSMFEVKQCALVAVDEIINSVVITDLTIAENQFIYWEEVKQEIENL